MLPSSGLFTVDSLTLNLCHTAQGGQGKYCLVSLSLTISVTNFTNVNDPLYILSLKVIISIVVVSKIYNISGLYYKTIMIINDDS
jgi:hypothetical protein